MSKYLKNTNLCSGSKILFHFIFGTKLCQLVRGKKRRNTISMKDFIGKQSPKFDKFHHISYQGFFFSKSPNLDSNISSKVHSEVSKKNLLFSRTCIAKYG